MHLSNIEINSTSVLNTYMIKGQGGRYNRIIYHGLDAVLLGIDFLST